MEVPKAVVVLGFALLVFLISDVSAGDPKRPHSRLPALEQRAPAVSPQSPAAAAAPPSSAVVLAQYTFDDGSLPDAQGWLSEDLGVVQDTFFHVDDFAGLGPDYTPISGSQSLWCGTADESIVCDWVSPPGYGDRWYQFFESVAFATTGDVTLSFDMRYDCEAGFDSVTVEFKDKHGDWQEWASYSGTGTTTFNAVLTQDTLDGSASFRIRFESDVWYSDDDGFHDTDGALIVDNITISDQTGTVDVQDFESEAVGDRTTADGDWQAYAGEGFGDYAGLFSGVDVLQEDPFVSNSTHLWGFFNGSSDTYACGGHPEQLAVPLRIGDGPRKEAIENQIYSPWIDLSQDLNGTPLEFTPEYVVLDFDAYTDNPIDNAVFFGFRMRFLVDGCATDWASNGWAYDGSEKRWAPWRFTWPNYMENATHVQVAILVIEGSIWGSGVCHSHAPLIDNVTVSVLENTFCHVISGADSGSGTLRQAILDANSLPDTNVIVFSLDGEGGSIVPETPLPAITAPVVIDGYSQPQSSPNTSPPGAAGNAVLKVRLYGGHLGAGAGNYGLQLDADHCTVRGLVINSFGSSAIYCPNSDGHVIEGNYIGTDATGTIAMGNGGVGAVYLSSSDSSIVGGTNPAARNVISGNDQTAIDVAGDGNIVQGNLLGIDATGAVAMGNGNHGVHIRGFGNTIGGTTAAARNVISDNAYSGIFIGGTELTAANNVVQGNYIGTDITGTVAIGNESGGVIVSRSPGNLIGGPAPGAGNVLAASKTYGSGVKILYATSTGNVVQGNFIGTDTSGTQPLGNTYQGVMIEHSASNNTIGGTTAGAGNTIAFNGFFGVVVPDTCVGNAILSNSIFSNGQMGIALGYDGITMNDSADVDTGPNDFQNFPVLTAATTGSIRIDGTLNSTPDTEFRLEFFSNTVCNPPGYGQGETFIGTTSVTTDGMGDASFTANFSEPVSPGSFVTATATDPEGNTSEFSECIAVTCNPVLYVDESATGTGDGASWLNAYTELRDALATAHSCEIVTEIWVAAGTYTPTAGTDRAATFQLKDSLAVYGGFNGTETSLDERDWTTNVTILSGDIGVVADSTDNSYHVVTGGGTNASAVLDGFTITRGGATEPVEPDGFGGGMFNLGPANPTVVNVIFLNNVAIVGAGMYNRNSSPTIINTVFSENFAANGGGMCNWEYANPIIVNSTFYGNRADVYGGGIYNSIVDVPSGYVSLTNTILWGNSAGDLGDQIANDGRQTDISYSLIEGSGGSGGGWDPSLGTDGGNNLDADPMFVGAPGDLTLDAGSPAIDAGDSTAVPAGVTTDLAGGPRIHGAQVDMGAYEWDGIASGIGGDGERPLPRETALRSVYPNPFNPTVTIEFDVDRRQDVDVSIYDVHGRLVRRLTGMIRSAGTHRVQWHGRDDKGNEAATGVYFVRLRTHLGSDVRKIVLLK